MATVSPARASRVNHTSSSRTITSCVLCPCTFGVARASIILTLASNLATPQEFGIDIVGEDNKTIVHHKVSSKAFCVFNQADVEASLR